MMTTRSILLAAVVGAVVAQPGGMPAGMDAAKLQEMMAKMGGGGPGGMGGMPGMGGPGGGMGGAPPPAKEISAKQAKTLLKEITHALKQQKAGMAIQGALKQLGSQPPPADPKAAAQKRMEALMPVLTQFTAAVTSKHKFTYGFMEAMQSAQRHAGADKGVARMLEPIRLLVTGQNPMAMAGRIEAFDKLAAKFATAADEAGRAAVLKEAEAKIAELTVGGKLTKPLAKFYVKVMKKVLKKGQGWVEEEAKKLMKQMDPKGAASDKKKMKSIKRVNILGGFIRKEDIERMMKKVKKDDGKASGIADAMNDRKKNRQGIKKGDLKKEL